MKVYTIDIIIIISNFNYIINIIIIIINESVYPILVYIPYFYLKIDRIWSKNMLKSLQH